MPAPDGLVIVVPDALVDELVERVVQRLALPAAERWVGVEGVAAHLGCRRQRIYDLVTPSRSARTARRAWRTPGFKAGTVKEGTGTVALVRLAPSTSCPCGRSLDAFHIAARSLTSRRLGFGRLTQPWVWVKRPTGMVRYAIKGVETTPKGQVVCTSGAVSGYHCGPVTEVNKTVSLGKSILPWAGTKVQHESAVDVCRRSNNPIMPGDSGAPVFKSHKARGTLSGGNHSGCTMFYQGAVEAQNLLNVNIVTSGG